MTKAERERRNEEIVRLHLEQGLLLSDLGTQFSISAEAVRKIVRRAGITPEQSADATGRGRTLWWCEHCGKEERRGARRRGARFCSNACANAATAAARRQYSDAELFEHLRRRSEELGHTPDHAELDGVEGPSASTYYLRFGSLREAQRRAGLPPNRQGALGHKPKRGD